MCKVWKKRSKEENYQRGEGWVVLFPAYEEADSGEGGGGKRARESTIPSKKYNWRFDFLMEEDDGDRKKIQKLR